MSIARFVLLDDGTYMATRFEWGECTDKEVKLFSDYAGAPVTKIDEKTFYGNKYIEVFKLINSIEQINAKETELKEKREQYQNKIVKILNLENTNEEDNFFDDIYSSFEIYQKRCLTEYKKIWRREHSSPDFFMTIRFQEKILSFLLTANWN